MSEPRPTITACIRVEDAQRHLWQAADLLRDGRDLADDPRAVERLLRRIDLKLTAMHDALAMAEHALHRTLVPDDLTEARERLNS